MLPAVFSPIALKLFLCDRIVSMASSREQSQLLPAYLIVGEDELKRKIVIKRLRERVAALGDLSFNFDSLSGDGVAGSEIVQACNIFPFASPIRLVEVTKVDRLRKADSEDLITYLATPCQTTVLCLVAEKLAKNTRLYKAVAALGASAIIDCAPQKRRDLAQTVRALGKEHGVVLSASAAEKLIELVGENTISLDSELRRIALAHVGGDTVGDAELVLLVKRSNEPKTWEFANAFAARDIAACLSMFAAMKAGSSFRLIVTCTTRLRELICAKSLGTRGEQAQLASELAQPEWRVRNLFGWAHNFSDFELRRALSASRDTECAMKSGTDPDKTFQLWLLNTVAPHK